MRGHGKEEGRSREATSIISLQTPPKLIENKTINGIASAFSRPQRRALGVAETSMALAHLLER